MVGPKNKKDKNILAINSLSLELGGRLILNNINLAIEKGDFVGLTGPNGAGKSTLVKTILGLLPFYKGEVFLFGKKLSKFNQFEKIGYFPQKNILVEQVIPVNVNEIITTGIANYRKGFFNLNKKIKKKVEEILEKIEITYLKEKIFSSLSGGEQQKVLLARALVDKPELLILDEPSSALDFNSRSSFFNLLTTLHQDGVTIILITHDTGYVGRFAKTLLYLDGEVKYYGALDRKKVSSKLAGYFEKTESHLIWHQHK